MRIENSTTIRGCVRSRLARFLILGLVGSVLTLTVLAEPERYYERWMGSGAPPSIGSDDAGRLEPLADDYKYIEDMPIFDLEGKGVLVTFDRGNDNWVQVKDGDGNDVMFDSPDPNQTNQMRLERIQMVVVVEEELNEEPVYVLTGERVEKTNQDLMNHDWSEEEGRWVPAPSGRVVFERTIYSDPETGSYYTKMVHMDPEGNEHVNWERARLQGLPMYEDGDGKVYEYDEFTKRLSPMEESYERDHELSNEIYGSAPDSPERAYEWLSNVEDELELIYTPNSNFSGSDEF